ncbi:MAG: RNA polymerase sigma-54 factor [Rhodospirillaceae bacterium]|nr:RNA polymerase sigma-54 factor [Rhodospirillaceae bacterium]
MARGLRLDLRQSQSLVMTPQLQQAIKLLQMSNVELTDYIAQEVERNPLLELEDLEGGVDAAPAAPTAESSADAQEMDSCFASKDIDDFDGDTVNTDDPSFDDADLTPDASDYATSESIGGDERSLDTDYENVYEPESASDGAQPGGEGQGLLWNTSSGGGFHNELTGMRNLAVDKMTLRDHLIGQINIDLRNPVDIMIAGRLMDMLDDNGWLSGSLEPVAIALGCTIERVQNALARCQQCDPPGIFARTLSECLTIQLREKNRLDPAMLVLLENLELIARREFAQLRRLCGVDNEDLLQMITEIKKLNPRPASEFDHDVASPVVPDVFVRRSKVGWLVELNANVMPRVLVNNRYCSIVRKHARSKDDKKFLSDRLQSANWLVRALHQRAETILKVASELVVQQETFFEKGVEFMQPLTLRDVANVVGVHESTVSRVTANKYLGTSYGTFEMKYFFSSAIGQGKSGEPRSAKSIGFRIKALIDRETHKSVLSDHRIVDILRDEGVDIARRTVAKYRDEMHIPSSVQRRRDKALQVYALAVPVSID